MWSQPVRGAQHPEKSEREEPPAAELVPAPGDPDPIWELPAEPRVSREPSVGPFLSCSLSDVAELPLER